MKAILLAAGKSTRLGKIAENTPKPMLRVNDEIILEHNIKWLKQYNIENIYINLHYLPDTIKDHFKDGNGLGVRINYSYEKNILGTAGGVKQITSLYVKDNWKESFLVIYGDNFYPFDYDLGKLISFHEEKGALISMGLYKKKSEVWKSGVAVIANSGQVEKFAEKPDPKEINSNLVNTGIYILSPEVIRHIPDGFSDFSQDVIPELLRKHLPVYGHVFDKDLTPVDTPELLKKANK